MDINRFLIDFDSESISHDYYDILIIGSGVAGVYTALEIPDMYRVAILSKEEIDISNSALAQGGIAVSLGKEDSPKFHFKDTIFAGAGLCNEESVWVLVNAAAANIDNLCKYGVNFDRKSSNELSLTREGAHSMNRIIHAGDTTGKEVCDTLTSIVKTRNNVKIEERVFAVDLITENGECKGILAYDEIKCQYRIYIAPAVVCATGGYGQLYTNTTNPEVATGDGVSLAYRAGAELMDLEFIQFHPTVLFHPENKSFLISEAVRGEGALLKNSDGYRFMPDYHPLQELAPRDVVSRAIFEEMKKTASDHVYLDISFKDKQYLENRFPNIYKTCLEYGIDISKQYIPVAPAEHYCMGGIKTDVYGRTCIPGFYACGEAACNGIHGANRLASNSLLEGLVFGKVISEEIDKYMKDRALEKLPVAIKYNQSRTSKSIDAVSIRKQIQEIMTKYVGITRDSEGLEHAKEQIKHLYNEIKDMKNDSILDFELQNSILLSLLVIQSALERKESRGAHFRTDYSSTDDISWKRNVTRSKNSDRYI